MEHHKPTLAEYWSLRYSAGGQPPTRVLSQRLGAVLAWAGMRSGLSPSAVTLLGTFTFALGAVLYVALPPGLLSALLVLLLLQLGYGLDCADGQLARGTRRTSAFGAWLDIACDYTRNVMLGGALALALIGSTWPASVAVAVGSTFVLGGALQLHTVTVARQTERAPTGGHGSLVARLRGLITSALDTPTVMLVLALARDLHDLLALATVGVGFLHGLMAVYVARRRLL